MGHFGFSLSGFAIKEKKVMLLPSTISDDVFHLFKEVIYRESGIKLTDVKKALVQSRLMKRLRTLKINDYKEYYDFLNANYDEEIINLINCITTNKTDFFREPKHFCFMREVILPFLDKQNTKNIRIWSAGCSSGEEPYSIAMTVFEYYHGKHMPDIKILATDIDTDVLNKGKEGIYKEEDLQDVDPNFVERYFNQGEGKNKGLFKVRDLIKRIVYFRRLNLLENSYPMKAQFDIIFCRNVIIYFDNESRVRVFDQFYRYLKDNGYFFAGHSETLTNICDKFDLKGNTIYQKVL